MFGPVMIVKLQLEEAYWREEGRGKGKGHVRGGQVNASHYDVRTTLLGTAWLAIRHLIKHWMAASLDTKSIQVELWTN